MKVYNLVSLLFYGIIMLAKGQIYDVFVCWKITVPQTISCGHQRIIEIKSVTIAVVPNRSECSHGLISVVEQLDNDCKRTDVKPRDGNEVFRRCFGEESCTFDNSVVEQEFLGHSCDPEHQKPYTNVLWFKYSCHLVDPYSPSVALLPLPENAEVKGLEVDIFSPYYPCFTPVPDVPEEELLVLDCSITPQRMFQGSYVTFTVMPKNVEIRQNPSHCQDFLSFDYGSHGGRLSRTYCGETTYNLEVSSDRVITSNSAFISLHIKYIVQKLATGAKFWLRVTAVENRTQVNVLVTCSEQENIPPLPSGATCIPLRAKTSTTSANMSSDISTTEAATTAPSTDNLNPELYLIKGEKDKSDSDTSTSGLLPGILGGVFGLLFVGAIVVTLLCCVIRKRKGQTEEAGKSAVTETRRSRPKSILQIVATLKKKKRAPNHPDEEMANGNNSKTKPEKPPKASKPTKPPKPPKPDTTLQTYVRPSSIAKMAALLKKGNNTKRKTTNNENKNDSEADEKAGGKSMEINDRYEKTRKTSNVNEASEESRYEHLYAVPLRKESKFSESDRSKSKTTEVNATNPDENDDPEAGNEAGQEFQNEQLYAVPIKKDRKIAESDGSRSNTAEVNATDTDETLMCENDDLYSSFQVEENNAVSEKDDGAQVVKKKGEETDIVAENAVSKETLESAISGYENVKPDTTDIDKNNNDEINNETCTITVPDGFSNNPGSRISLA